MTTKYKCLYEITGRIEDVATFLVPISELPKEPEQEPLCTAAMFDDAFLAKSGLSPDTKLYTTPPQRTWVGLESEEIRKAKHHMVDGAYHYSFKQGAEWAEAKLEERNK